jgi:transcriptional regulator with XRE-family HTH domain
MEGVMTSRADEQLTYPFVEAIIDIIADWVKKYRSAAGLRDDLARCGSDEVARVARDLGVSPGELVGLARKGPHAADQLKKLLLALGVDPRKLASEDPAMMRDLQRICITCGCKRRCEHELAAGTAAQHFRSYCPNAVSLDALFASK